MANVVWILGAGFSRSLGGPLLPELFATGSELRLRAAFPEREKLHRFEANAARTIYQMNHEGGLRLWRDAEEYLDYVDTAQDGGPEAPAHKSLRELLDGIGAATVDAAASAARRLLVAECCAFLVRADVMAEKWRPYVRWADQLQPGDVVVTFNYDLVVEKLQRDTSARHKLNVLLPSLTPGGPAPLRLDEHVVSIIKLHGSVNWRQDVRAASVVQVSADRDDWFALECPDDKMVIASPGPSKLLATNGLLSPLWEAAKTAIKNADAIVFVGYRFPPTDSAARRELIEAIGGNERQYLALHTVLGPDTRGPNAERLRAMLNVAVARRARTAAPPNHNPFSPPPRYFYTLKMWPLVAEDFLDLYDHGQLPRQYMHMPDGHPTD